MSSPTLSVVVPSYNYGQFLGESIESLLSQSRVPDEILIVDDGSTDDSVALARAFAARSPNVRVLENEQNIGALRTVNRGLTEVTGDWVHFQSADDRLIPGFYAAAMSLAAQYPEAGLVTGLVRWMSPDGRKPLGWMTSALLSDGPRFLSPGEVKHAFAREGYSLLSHATLYRREALMEMGSFPAELNVRADGFALIVLARRYGVCFLPQYCADARVAVAAYHQVEYRASRASETVDRACELLRQDHPDVFDESEIEFIFRQWHARLRLAQMKMRRSDHLARMRERGRGRWARAVASLATGLGYGVAVIALSPDRIATVRRRLRRFRPSVPSAR